MESKNVSIKVEVRGWKSESGIQGAELTARKSQSGSHNERCCQFLTSYRLIIGYLESNLKYQLIVPLEAVASQYCNYTL